YRCIVEHEMYSKDQHALVKESISTYNNMRPHLSLRMKTPNEVHEKSQQLTLLA
ncbi:IS3 family transposase, partial [Vibrio sp. 10N.239.311.G01]